MLLIKLIAMQRESSIIAGLYQFEGNKWNCCNN